MSCQAYFPGWVGGGGGGGGGGGDDALYARGYSLKIKMPLVCMAQRIRTIVSLLLAKKRLNLVGAPGHVPSLPCPNSSPGQPLYHTCAAESHWNTRSPSFVLINQFPKPPIDIYSAKASNG